MEPVETSRRKDPFFRGDVPDPRFLSSRRNSPRASRPSLYAPFSQAIQNSPRPRGSPIPRASPSRAPTTSCSSDPPRNSRITVTHPAKIGPAQDLLDTLKDEELGGIFWIRLAHSDHLPQGLNLSSFSEEIADQCEESDFFEERGKLIRGVIRNMSISPLMKFREWIREQLEEWKLEQAGEESQIQGENLTERRVKMDQLLLPKSWKRTSIPPDGDCFFACVAAALKLKKEDVRSQLVDALSQACFGLSVSTLQTQQRPRLQPDSFATKMLKLMIPTQISGWTPAPVKKYLLQLSKSGSYADSLAMIPVINSVFNHAVEMYLYLQGSNAVEKEYADENGVMSDVEREMVERQKRFPSKISMISCNNHYELLTEEIMT